MLPLYIVIRKWSHILFLILAVAAFCPALSAKPAPRHAPIESQAEAPAVSAVQGAVIIANGSDDTTFSIFSITGQVIKTIRLGAGSSVTIDLPQGFYIVRCQDWARKVLVK